MFSEEVVLLQRIREVKIAKNRRKWHFFERRIAGTGRKGQKGLANGKAEAPGDVL
jgi:hypothetical protein